MLQPSLPDKLITRINLVVADSGFTAFKAGKLDIF
jgi:hypothetical protein